MATWTRTTTTTMIMMMMILYKDTDTALEIIEKIKKTRKQEKTKIKGIIN